MATPKFGEEANAAVDDPTLDEEDVEHEEVENVSINLYYYHVNCECFSAWNGRELKKFSKAIEKVRCYKPNTLKVTGSLCEMHKNKPKKPRFVRPDGVSKDVPFYEIKVDQSNKCRIHGFFVGSVFYLVWLDRSHECFNG
ncbi:MAG: hypothetical protein KGZ69_06200 [Methylomonas sp.]|nr:hypothetical protein [Methylomonas sp.]